ncbi:MAG: hypothetical protein CM15mP80_06200 [Alphaproteobacteria bacterium]|nr:MAG: hypothetical protein CM15mP80_06200 [Alphaproteobacteria bacterium]
MVKYSEDHEWVKLEGDVVTVGITDFAQNELGDIVFVELLSRGQLCLQAGIWQQWKVLRQRLLFMRR